MVLFYCCLAGLLCIDLFVRVVLLCCFVCLFVCCLVVSVLSTMICFVCCLLLLMFLGFDAGYLGLVVRHLFCVSFAIDLFVACY